MLRSIRCKFISIGTMSVSEYALKRSVNAFSSIWYLVISNLRLDWRRTSPIQGKVQSASWTIIAFRIDNQFALVGTVSLLPLHLLPNGTSPVRYEPHLAKWVLLLLRAPNDRIIYLPLSFCLEFYIPVLPYLPMPMVTVRFNAMCCHYLYLVFFCITNA